MQIRSFASAKESFSFGHFFRHHYARKDNTHTHTYTLWCNKILITDRCFFDGHHETIWAERFLQRRCNDQKTVLT